ncbi:MAG: response regulator [Polyangiaceae bacterium]
MSKILVIDDDAAIRANIADLLEAEGHEVTCAENGATGLTLAERSLPDLIVCDVAMPELDGYGVLTALREGRATRDIPFVFLSAKAERADVRLGMNLGADDYLTKPFTRVELLDAIASRLRRRLSARAVPMEPKAAPAPVPKVGPAALTLGPGDVFDRYRIEERVGTGGMGIVFRAHDAKLDRLVALKVLQPREIYLAPSVENASLRLVAEARAAAKLSHPHVISIYDVGAVDGVPFLAMEFVVGATLRAKTDAPWEQKLKWLVEVADALSAAHRAGLIHRDVKPENVMVRADGRALVLDFGIARITEGRSPVSSSGTGQLIRGTPFYMSPEQLFGEAVDGRSDQFSWGVMAYELFSGELPWGDAEGPVAIVKAITRVVPPALGPLAPALPAHVAAAVDRALSKAPSDRFASMELLLAEIAPGRTSSTGGSGAPPPALDDAALADTEPVRVAGPARAPVRTTDPPSPGPASSVAVIALAAAVALAVAFVVWLLAHT